MVHLESSLSTQSDHYSSRLKSIQIFCLFTPPDITIPPARLLKYIDERHFIFQFQTNIVPALPSWRFLAPLSQVRERSLYNQSRSHAGCCCHHQGGRCFLVDSILPVAPPSPRTYPPRSPLPP